MYKTKKRITAWILVVILAVGIIGSAAYYTYANNYDAPSVALLDAMLEGDRQWVLETIIDDNRSNNPYAYLISETSLMEKALSQYENKDDPDYNALFSLLVGASSSYVRSGLWPDVLEENALTQWGEEHPGEMMLLFGSNTPALLLQTVHSVQKLVELEKLDNILYAVFDETYTSSWGETVNEQEASLQQLNEISKTLENIQKLNEYWADIYSTGNDVGEAENTVEFMNQVTIPLYQTGEDFLKEFDRFTTSEKMAVPCVLALAHKQAAYNWKISKSGENTNPYIKKDLTNYVAGDEGTKIIDGFAAGFELSSNLIKQYSFLNALNYQKELFQGTVNRTAEQAYSDGHRNMSTVLEKYASMMDDVLDSNKLAVDTILRSFGSMIDIEEELKISTIAKNVTEYAAKKGYERTSLYSAAAIWDIGMVVVDECTDLKNTVAKTTELLYLRDIITEAKKTYQNDLKQYRKNKNEETANQVLMDILFIQRLRLRGENIAFDMSKGQFNSWIGRLLSARETGEWAENIFNDTDLVQAWSRHYQRSVDALIGATICPMSFDSFKVGSGEEVTIFYDEQKNTYGSIISKDGVMDTYLYEMQYRVANGIDVDGGSITINGVSVPYVVANSNSFIGIDGAQIGEITQSGNLDLELYNRHSTEKYTLELPNTMEIQNADLRMNGNAIRTPKLTVSNEIRVENGVLYTENLMTKNATVTGTTIYCTGDVNITRNNYLESLVLNGNGKQMVDGSLTVTNLSLDNQDNKAITILGDIYIGGRLKDPDNILTSGLILNGNGTIDGDRLASDIILDGVTIEKPVTYGRNVTLYGDSTLYGGIVKGTLKTNGNQLENKDYVLVLENGIQNKNGAIVSNEDIEIHEESYLEKAEFDGDGTIKLYTTSVTGSGNTLKSVEICGTQKQVIDMSAQIEKLTISNTSIGGVQLNESFEVTNMLKAGKQKIINGNNLHIQGDASVSVDGTRSSMVLQDWRGTWEGKLIGNVYTEGNTCLSDSMEIDGGVIQNNGTLTLEDGEMKFVNLSQQQQYSYGADLNISENASVTITEDVVLNQSCVNNGKLKVMGDFLTSWNYSGTGELECLGDASFQYESTFGSLVTSGNRAQTIDGKTLYVDHYKNTNRGAGVTFQNSVYVSKSYANHGWIKGIQPIFMDEKEYIGNVTWDNKEILENTTVDGNLTIKGNVTIVKGASVTVSKDVLVQYGAITVQEGASLVIRGNMIGDLHTFTVDGECRIWQDCKLNSGNVSGMGTWILCGDLENSAAINDLNCLYLAGKVPQEISGKEIHVSEVKTENNSKDGIVLDTTIYYKDKCTIGDGCTINEEYMKEDVE